MWGIRSYVMARKGILLSNPDVSKMSPSQWLFEYHSLVEKERNIFDLSFKTLKQLMIHLMGLNAIRPEDGTGRPKTTADMTKEEREAFLPLIAWIGHPEMLKQVQDQLDYDNAVRRSEDDDRYEQLVSAIDELDGDMTPIFGPVVTKQHPQDNSNDKYEDVKLEDIEGDI